MEEGGVARLRMVDLCSSERLHRITLSLLAPQLVPFKTSSNKLQTMLALPKATATTGHATDSQVTLGPPCFLAILVDERGKKRARLLSEAGSFPLVLLVMGYYMRPSSIRCHWTCRAWTDRAPADPAQMRSPFP